MASLKDTYNTIKGFVNAPNHKSQQIGVLGYIVIQDEIITTHHFSHFSFSVSIQLNSVIIIDYMDYIICLQNAPNTKLQ